MRTILVALTIGTVAAACGGGDDGGGNNPGGADACVGLQCDVKNCAAMNAPPTSISGTVFAPNGTLPLWNVNVYIPNDAVPAFPEGAQCSRCNDSLPGNAVVRTTTDEAGNFRLENVPVGSDIPVVISIGKWRKQFTIPAVTACVDTPIEPTKTSLPKTRAEGDIPRIAISTGNADGLECLIRKLGIADSEIHTDGSDARIHLFTNTQSGGQGASSFAGGFPGGTGNMTDSQTLWGTATKLSTYDIVIFSCEGGQFADTKSQDHMNALKAYADLGGRVFLSHWHNIWIEGATTPNDGGNQEPLVWPTTSTFDNGGALGDGIIDTVDESGPRGQSMATWLLNVGASTQRGQIPIQDDTGKGTASGVRGDTERFVYYQDGGTQRPQNFQFTTPYEAGADARCGKVVFSDMHVSGDSTSSPGTPYPGGCAASGLTPQEKALAFMFFDIASCISVIF